jgi:hypothetical protein
MGSDGSVMAMGKTEVTNAALKTEKALHSQPPVHPEHLGQAAAGQAPRHLPA